jgi:hypothetical protein
VHKPAILGEFGYLDKATRNPVYQQWTDAFVRAHGTGLAYWMLAGLHGNGIGSASERPSLPLVRSTRSTLTGARAVP